MKSVLRNKLYLYGALLVAASGSLSIASSQIDARELSRFMELSSEIPKSVGVAQEKELKLACGKFGVTYYQLNNSVIAEMEANDGTQCSGKCTTKVLENTKIENIDEIRSALSSTCEKTESKEKDNKLSVHQIPVVEISLPSNNLKAASITQDQISQNSNTDTTTNSEIGKSESSKIESPKTETPKIEAKKEVEKEAEPKKSLDEMTNSERMAYFDKQCNVKSEKLQCAIQNLSSMSDQLVDIDEKERSKLINMYYSKNILPQVKKMFSNINGDSSETEVEKLKDLLTPLASLEYPIGKDIQKNIMVLTLSKYKTALYNNSLEYIKLNKDPDLLSYEHAESKKYLDESTFNLNKNFENIGTAIFDSVDSSTANLEEDKEVKKAIRDLNTNYFRKQVVMSQRMFNPFVSQESQINKLLLEGVNADTSAVIMGLSQAPSNLLPDTNSAPQGVSPEVLGIRSGVVTRGNPNIPQGVQSIQRTDQMYPATSNPVIPGRPQINQFNNQIYPGQNQMFPSNNAPYDNSNYNNGRMGMPVRGDFTGRTIGNNGNNRNGSDRFGSQNPFLRNDRK
jgi:hypothetical protein